MASADPQAADLKHRWNGTQENGENFHPKGYMSGERSTWGKKSITGNMIEKLETIPLANSSREQNDHGMSV
jgi:hypothetical protein